MSEAIVRVTEVDPEWDATVSFEVVAHRGMTNLWEPVGEERAVDLGLPKNDDDEYETRFEKDGVEYAWFDGEWFEEGDQPEYTADGVQLAIEEALGEESDKKVGDLYAVDITYHGDGEWEVEAMSTLSAVLEGGVNL